MGKSNQGKADTGTYDIEKSMLQLRETKHLLSHDRCLVCPLSDASPNRFQKLFRVSRLKGEANDLLLALFICPCQIKHFPGFPPSGGQKNLFSFSKNQKFWEELLLTLKERDTIQFLKLEILLPSGTPVSLNSISLLQFIYLKKHDEVCQYIKTRKHH